MGIVIFQNKQMAIPKSFLGTGNEMAVLSHLAGLVW